MDAAQVTAIENELFHHDCIIKAAEDWSPIYTQNEADHARLIRLESAYERDLRRLLRKKADEVDRYVAWYMYDGLVRADYTVETVVSGDFFDGIDGDFLTMSFDTISTAIVLGTDMAEDLYKFRIGAETTDAIIQRLTSEHLGTLIGKKVDKAGNLVDNPRSRYRISDKTRRDVVKSVQTSISLGEDRTQALARMKKAIANPKRAEAIAQTEIINAHATGTIEYGRQTGATGKESQSVGAIDRCGAYARMGIVALDYLYDGEKIGPSYHTRCRCGLRLVYANEYTPK